MGEKKFKSSDPAQFGSKKITSILCSNDTRWHERVRMIDEKRKTQKKRQ